jgi:hypothetical protein
MAQVRRIIDNELLTVPFNLTHQGLAGQVVIDNFGEGDRVYFKYGINIDDSNDVTEVTTHVSMADFYSLSLDPIDPEGIKPEDPDPVLEPNRIPTWTVPEPAYKTFIETGTYAGRTRIFLNITNNEENFPVEFSAFYHGSLNGTPGSNSPNTWAVIPRETDGTYYLMLPSNDDTPPAPQPFWVRFQGNTGTQFGNYITFRTNGDDPLDEDGGSEEPVVGSSNAVVRTDFDYVWTVWGGFSGRDTTRLDATASKTHFAEMSAMSGSGANTYKHQRPFYAFDTAPKQIQVPIPVNGDPYHINEVRYADTDWQMNANDMKMCNEYLIRSGFQCWNFTYYASTYQLAQMRTFWENLTLGEKRGIKAFYSVGQLGGDRNTYRLPNGNIDLTNDYTINLNHIVDMMGQSWYKKIDGKPVVVYFNSESESLTDMNNLRAAYNAAYGGSDSYPFYEIYMTMMADTNNTFVYNNNLKARTWYYQTNNEAQDSHDIQTIINDAYSNFLNMGNTFTPKDVCPSFTVALDGRSRNAYPGATACIDSLTNGSNPFWQSLNRGYEDKSYSWYNPANQSNVNDIVSKCNALRTTFGTRMRLALVSTWDELSEGGASCGMPKKRVNGTINDDVIEWFRSQLNLGYVNP